MSLVERYVNAMKRGDTDHCIEIEMAHGLFGYPPEIVSAGLAAADAGGDAYLGALDYIDNMENPA